jgi:hypothetical protein
VATLVVVLVPLTVLAGGLGAILFVAPLVAFFCVLLGSVLTIIRGTRQFAVGFLIASAILIFVTSGVCTAALRFTNGSV